MFFQSDFVSVENKGVEILIPKLKVASSSLVACFISSSAKLQSRTFKNPGKADFVRGISHQSLHFLRLASQPLRNIRFQQGASILISSRVPAGKGVSSSAALEVAAMQAICAAFAIEIGAHEWRCYARRSKTSWSARPAASWIK